MFRFISLSIFIVLLVIQIVSADWCFDPDTGNSWSCDPGQTCGSKFDQCHGASTYVVGSIIFGSICFISLCIRCCIRSTMNNTQSIQRTTQRSDQIHSIGNNLTTRSPHTVAIYEDAPPSYADATSTTTLISKY